MELLKKYTQCFGPSGREDAVRDIIINEIQSFCDEIYTDALGNLIARKGKGGNKIIAVTNMDETGVIVTALENNGFLRFALVGGVDKRSLAGRRVVFENGTAGLIASENDNDNFDVSKMYIDAGVDGGINPGDMACFCGDFIENSGIIVSKSLSGRVGCYILTRAIKEIKQPENELYFIFSTQKEVGMRGAKTAAYGIGADYAVSVDTTACDDVPGGESHVRLGGGCTVKVMDKSVIAHHEVREKLTELANAEAIDYQLEVNSNMRACAGAVQTCGMGVKTGGISVPVRNIFSPSEIASTKDIECALKLLKLFLCR